MFQGEKWLARRWQSLTRYYTAEVVQDLFGQWVLQCSWGGLGTRRGNWCLIHMPDYGAALVALQQLDKRRRARGYQAV